MKRMNSRLVYLLFLYIVIICSCSQIKEDYADMVVRKLEEKNINLANYSHIVVIPELGCGGCISEAEKFFRENREQSILFIFTKISSMKEIRLRLGKMIEQKNVLIDNEQLYVSKEEEINVYPIIIDIRCISQKTWYFLEPGVSYRSLLNVKATETSCV